MEGGQERGFNTSSSCKKRHWLFKSQEGSELGFMSRSKESIANSTASHSAMPGHCSRTDSEQRLHLLEHQDHFLQSLGDLLCKNRPDPILHTCSNLRGSNHQGVGLVGHLECQAPDDMPVESCSPFQEADRLTLDI